MAEAEPPSGDVADPHRSRGCAAALRRTAGVEDLEVPASLVERQVRVAEEDPVHLGEPPTQPLEPPPRGAGVVDQREAHSLALDHLLGGQELPQLAAVHVPVNRLDGRADRAEVIEDAALAEVAEVDDEVRALELGDAAAWELPADTRHVGVAEDRDPQAGRSQAPSIAGRTRVIRMTAIAAFRP